MKKITFTVFIFTVLASVCVSPSFTHAVSQNYNSSKSNTAGIMGDPIPGVDVSVEQSPSGIKATNSNTPTPAGLQGDPIPGVDVSVEQSPVGIKISSDLGVDDVGTLPTSYFYFLKEWGRGVNRLFTWRAVSKAKLELKITNEKAAEIIAVEKANPNDAKALKIAVDNYADAQARLALRITNIRANATDENVAKVLEDADAKTAKQSELLNELIQKHSTEAEYADIKSTVEKARDTIEKNFIAAGIRVATGDVNGDGTPDKVVPATSSVETRAKLDAKATTKTGKVSENESPRPAEQKPVETKAARAGSGATESTSSKPEPTTQELSREILEKMKKDLLQNETETDTTDGTAPATSAPSGSTATTTQTSGGSTDANCYLQATLNTNANPSRTQRVSAGASGILFTRADLKAVNCDVQVTQIKVEPQTTSLVSYLRNLKIVSDGTQFFRTLSSMTSSALFSDSAGFIILRNTNKTVDVKSDTTSSAPAEKSANLCISSIKAIDVATGNPVTVVGLPVCGDEVQSQ